MRPARVSGDATRPPRAVVRNPTPRPGATGADPGRGSSGPAASRRACTCPNIQALGDDLPPPGRRQPDRATTPRRPPRSSAPATPRTDVPAGARRSRGRPRHHRDSPRPARATGARRAASRQARPRREAAGADTAPSSTSIAAFFAWPPTEPTPILLTGFNRRFSPYARRIARADRAARRTRWCSTTG